MVNICYIKKLLLLTYLLTKYGIDIDVAICKPVEDDGHLWIWIYPWISTENLWIWIWMNNFISTASLVIIWLFINTYIEIG